MPIFEFECEVCGKSFEELVRSANAVEGVVCPQCQSGQVRKKISLFASKPAGGASNQSFSLSSPAASCSTST